MGSHRSLYYERIQPEMGKAVGAVIADTQNKIFVIGYTCRYQV